MIYPSGKEPVMADDKPTEPFAELRPTPANTANDYHESLEPDGGREPIEYTGPQDPADFAPPNTYLSPPDPTAEGDKELERRLKRMDADKAEVKKVEPPADSKATGRTRATTK